MPLTFNERLAVLCGALEEVLGICRGMRFGYETRLICRWRGGIRPITATAGIQWEAGEQDPAESDGPIHRCSAHSTPESGAGSIDGSV